VRKMWTGLTTIIAVLCIFWLMEYEDAHAFHYDREPPILLAEQDAENYWDTSLPCPHGIHVVYESRPPDKVSAGPLQHALEVGEVVVAAWASYEDPTCTVHLSTLIFHESVLEDGQSKIIPTYFLYVCDVMTHELGHFLGYEDVGQTNPSSIQYPLIEENVSPNFRVVPECVASVDRYYNS
jgi:hypothetical protein